MDDQRTCEGQFLVNILLLLLLLLLLLVVVVVVVVVLLCTLTHGALWLSVEFETIPVAIATQHCVDIHSDNITCYCSDMFCPADVDECIEGTSGCGQNCTNLVGSYLCGCYQGFLLNIDQHACSGEWECYLLLVC